MTKPPIIVAGAVDRTFLPYVEVVAASIAANATSGRKVHYHVLYSGPPSWMVGHLSRFRRGPVTIHIHQIENPWERFGTINGFPPSSLLRLSVEDVLPPHIERAIYLDVDVIVQHDLGALFDLPLNGHPIAAAVDSHVADLMADSPDGLDYVRTTLELGDAAHTYFQAGVMLLDLPALRASGYQHRMAEAFRRLGNQLRFADQCAANHVLRGDYQVIDSRWNVISTRITLEPDPWITHFAGWKPWHNASRPGAGRWWKVARSLPTFPIFAWRFVLFRTERKLAALRRGLRKWWRDRFQIETK